MCMCFMSLLNTDVAQVVGILPHSRHRPIYRIQSIPWMGKYFHYKMKDEITYPFPNFNGAILEV